MFLQLLRCKGMNMRATIREVEDILVSVQDYHYSAFRVPFALHVTTAYDQKRIFDCMQCMHAINKARIIEKFKIDVVTKGMQLHRTSL